ncbi:MAG: aspartate kinase [Eubacteriales bacterium]|nr:aspartate kinase [Eubacteriales bacterium]
MKELTVTKFGGTSMADAKQFRRVRDILLSDPRRRFVVPSAPGKRFGEDTKVTDLLYACHKKAMAGESYDELFDTIRRRYLSIVEELSLSCDITAELDLVYRNIAEKLSPDYTASRGEYLCGKLLAAYLGWEFIDAAEVIHFDRQGAFAAEWTNDVAAQRFAGVSRAVVPGFYGALPNGEVHTFSRGGSDITGAIVARAAGASLYENWTDVSGFMMADPRIVKDPLPIRTLTYRELRELSYMGATVLHEDSIFPVRKAGIPTRILNTNDPAAEGTIIVDKTTIPPERVVTGIAGTKNFSILSIEKSMMNSELGFGRRILQALEENGVSFEHLPTGIDTMCVIVHNTDLAAHKESIFERIRETCHPDSIELSGPLALIACVGRGMKGSPGSAATALGALAEADINLRMIDAGSSEENLIIGVDEEDYENAIRAVYGAFVKKGE